MLRRSRALEHHVSNPNDRATISTHISQHVSRCLVALTSRHTGIQWGCSPPVPPVTIMHLRNHPLMSYRGIDNWPPVWTWRGGAENIRPKGEVGILRDLFLSRMEQRSRLFLIMEHQKQEYMGCLLFNDSTFCAQICELL